MKTKSENWKHIVLKSAKDKEQRYAKVKSDFKLHIQRGKSDQMHDEVIWLK